MEIQVIEQYEQELLRYLLSFVSENKQGKFEQVIRNRTRHLTLVLEDIYQPHNASAVLRSCECFGIQDVHIIENSNKYHINPDVALGSSKWLSIYKYGSSEHNTEACLQGLKMQGYTIVATTPHENGFDLNELPLVKKTALVFGTEMQGLSDIALKMSDNFVKIPMYGFTESYNISVSAALCLYHLSERLRNSTYNWQLSMQEVTRIKLDWARQVVKNPEAIEERFLSEFKSGRPTNYH